MRDTLRDIFRDIFKDIGDSEYGDPYSSINGFDLRLSESRQLHAADDFVDPASPCVFEDSSPSCPPSADEQMVANQVSTMWGICGEFVEQPSPAAIFPQGAEKGVKSVF